MAIFIRRIHSYLANQSLYPLILASILAFSFLAIRVMYSGNTNYSNLLWNLILAWIPYLCSMGAYAIYLSLPKLWWMQILPGLLWILFFPNAPYIVTDFYHLYPRYPIPLWFDIGLIAIFAFTGIFLAIASLRTMHFIVQKYLGKFAGWLFIAIALALSALGIYLGRFGRYNSWDLLTQPKEVIKDIALQVMNPLDNLTFVGFTLMFTAILFVFYLMFVSSSRVDQLEFSNKP